jgi:Fe-S cluster assembly scaffold protein SufB
VAGEGEHVDLVVDTLQDAEESEAAAEAQAVALDLAKAAARGTARVTRRARGSRSRLEVEAIALGEGSAAYTAPMMLVETGDVAEASHRAAQYSSPEELLFYLRSRGLNRREAWSLVLYGKLSYTLRGASEELQRLAAAALGVEHQPVAGEEG